MERAVPVELVDHLQSLSGLDRRTAERLAVEVLCYFDEPLERFVTRRHGELRVAGLANPDIYRRIADELRRRPVSAPALSERQIRRIVYG